MAFINVIYLNVKKLERCTAWTYYKSQTSELQKEWYKHIVHTPKAEINVLSVEAILPTHGKDFFSRHIAKIWK